MRDFPTDSITSFDKYIRIITKYRKNVSKQFTDILFYKYSKINNYKNSFFWDSNPRPCAYKAHALTNYAKKAEKPQNPCHLQKP